MFVKRTAELTLLEEQYASSSSNMVILYGRKGLGKTTLLTDFVEGKPAYYYAASECADILQLSLMAKQWNENQEESKFLNYSDLFIRVRTREHKTIIVLDEFHFIMKNSSDFLEALNVLSDSGSPVMLILCSSSIRWVENEMLTAFGNYAANITAYMKLKEFTFVDFVNRFPKASIESCIYINAILGGVPDYLNEWQEGNSVKENIVQILCNKNNRLFLEPQQFLKLELREPAVYNTILMALAAGNHKLNDLHGQTGYSRAKISVYLKHLIQLDLVEKLVPLGDEGKENVKKGLYRIKDNFFSFWYRFVFPNYSELMLGREELVYDNWIARDLDRYMGEYFSDVCTEYLKLMNLHQRLAINYLWWDRWYGKNGTIDILAQGENHQSLVGKCLWEDRRMDVTDYQTLIALSGEAGITADTCYLFSKRGFSEELRQFVKEKGNSIHLVGLEDL